MKTVGKSGLNAPDTCGWFTLVFPYSPVNQSVGFFLSVPPGLPKRDLMLDYRLSVYATLGDTNGWSAARHISKPGSCPHIRTRQFCNKLTCALPSYSKSVSHVYFTMTGFSFYYKFYFYYPAIPHLSFSLRSLNPFFFKPNSH